MSPHQPKTLAVLQPGRLGDMVLTTPLFTGLKQLFPDAHLTVIADNHAAIIPQNHRAVDSVVSFGRGFLHLPMLARHLRNQEFDLFIDPKDHRSSTSRVIAKWVRATRILSHASNLPRGGPALKLPAVRPPGHFVDRMMAPLSALAPNQEFSRQPTIDIPSEAMASVDRQLNPGGKGMVTVNISAGHSTRLWQRAKWTELLELLALRFSVVVISSPSDRALADEICATRRTARTVATNSILEAAAVIARSDAVISLDTSIIHLASALNRPTIGLYPPIPQNTALFAPLATHHRIVMAANGGPVSEIAVEEVYGALESTFTETKMGQ